MFNLERRRKVVRDMSWLPYLWGRIKEQIILYVTEKMITAKNIECTRISIRTVSCRVTLIYHDIP
jgi:hypothetical protein